MPKPQQLLRGESIENKYLLLNLSDIKVLFRIGGIFSKIFLKKTISIVSIHFHYLGGCIRTHQDLTLLPFRKRIHRKLHYQIDVLILYVYDAKNHIPWTLI